VRKRVTKVLQKASRRASQQTSEQMMGLFSQVFGGGFEKKLQDDTPLFLYCTNSPRSPQSLADRRATRRADSGQLRADVR
jgi:hypothetical protein